MLLRTEFGKACLALVIVIFGPVQFCLIYDHCDYYGVGTHAERILDSIFWYCVFLGTETVIGLIGWALWCYAQWRAGPPKQYTN